MNKSKKKALIILIICFVLLVGGLIYDQMLSKSYLVRIKYDELIQKVQDKESFILLISQTTCSHCMDYKPKLKKVANEYKITVYYIETDLLNDDDHSKLKEYFNYRGTPQTIFVENGEEKSAATRIDGDVSEEKIISKFKSNGYIE